MRAIPSINLPLVALPLALQISEACKWPSNAHIEAEELLFLSEQMCMLEWLGLEFALQQCAAKEEVWGPSARFSLPLVSCNAVS